MLYIININGFLVISRCLLQGAQYLKIINVKHAETDFLNKTNLFTDLKYCTMKLSSMNKILHSQ